MPGPGPFPRSSSFGDMQIHGPNGIIYLDTYWDDMRFPFFGRQLDISAGHLTYDVAELGVNFDDTSRYNDLDQIGIIAQLTHSHAPGTALSPHIHWIQSSASIPNMLLKYRLYQNGASVPTWTLAKYDSNVFTYTSGSILQITRFPDISTASLSGVSAFLDIKVFRDTSNTSTLFAGADPLVGDWLAKEMDFHVEIGRPGSRTEYTY